MLYALLNKLKSFFPKEDEWWQDLTCSLCNKKVTQKPHNHCGHCKRTLCKNCDYVSGGCGWCGG